MKSNGGVMPSASVAENLIQTVMSGPAGGMIACKYFAGLSGDERVVTLDMGGTSCDVGGRAANSATSPNLRSNGACRSPCHSLDLIPI